MYRKDLVAVISDKLFVNQEVVAEFINAYEEAIVEALESGQEIKLSSFLTYKIKTDKGKLRHNLQIGELVYSPPSYRLVVVPSDKLKNIVRNQKVSDHEKRKLGIDSREEESDG